MLAVRIALNQELAGARVHAKRSTKRVIAGGLSLPQPDPQSRDEAPRRHRGSFLFCQGAIKSALSLPRHLNSMGLRLSNSRASNFCRNDASNIEITI